MKAKAADKSNLDGMGKIELLSLLRELKDSDPDEYKRVREHLYGRVGKNPPA